MPDTALDVPSVRDRVGAEEWDLRVDLAACYRLVAHYGWDDMIFTHNSARVPGTDHHFLLNPYGFKFEEITASSLVKIDLDGNKVMDGPYGVINAGFTIHSAVHMHREDALVVMHTHTTAGMAVAAQKDGLLMLNQKSMAFFNRVGYHDFERIARDLGPHKALILRNHGLLTTGGRTVAEAFVTMRRLQNACELQLAAQSGGAELIIPSDETCEHTARQFERGGGDANPDDSIWAALKRMPDRIDPSYRT